jgi:hypothetical protein
MSSLLEPEDSLSAAHSQGARCFKARVPAWKNPYHPKGLRSWAWDLGWRAEAAVAAAILQGASR